MKESEKILKMFERYQKKGENRGEVNHLFCKLYSELKKEEKEE